MRKIIRIGLIAVGALLLLWGILRLSERIIFRDFYEKARKEFPIPALAEGYVPQGLDYMPEYDSFLTSGYMANGEASRIYLVSRDGKAVCSLLKNPDGSDDAGHTGGAAYFEDYCYIPGSGGLEVFVLENILSDEETATKIGEVKLPVSTAWCTRHGDYMIIGTFYRKGSHETPPSQQLTTPAGDENKALAVVYKLDAAQLCGIDPEPVAALSLPEKVQGLCITDTDELALSTSWALGASYIKLYDIHKLQPEGSVELEGVQVPVVHLDSSAMTRTIKAPPMAEEIVCVDGRLYIIGESASNKYLIGKLLHGSHVYSYDLKN